MTPPPAPRPDAPWSCDDVRAHGVDDADGPPSLAARRALAEHVGRCPACQAERAREAALVARLRRVDPAGEPAPAALHRGLRALAVWTRRRPR